MTESEWHGRVSMAESEWDSLWITFAESDWAGRIVLAVSENTSAESPWPNPKILRPNHHGRLRMAGRIRMAESYALGAAVRNLVYHRHQLVLGAPDSSAHAWEKTVLSWTMRGANLGLA